MNADESTSMFMTAKISTRCAMTVGLMNAGMTASVSERRGTLRAPVGRHGASSFADMRLVLGAEMLQRRQRRRCLGVAERTQRLAGDVVRHARQQIEVAHLPFAAFNARQDLPEPVSSFAARRALAARFV